MNNQLLILGIAVLLICVGLSGCNERESTEKPTDNSIVIENHPPTASASADITSGYAPLTVSFTGSGFDSDGEIVSYFWDLGYSIEPSYIQNPTYIFNLEGTYEVSLTVTDDDETSATDILYIYVTEPPVSEPQIIDHSAYSWSDWVVVVGIIKNTASVCIDDVEIKATLYDSAGNVIKTSIEYNPYLDEYYYDEASPAIIEPDDTACFRISFDDVSYYDHYGLEIYSFETDYDEAYNDDLVLSNIQFSGGSVSGTIKNTGNNVYTVVKVHCMFFDKNGKIVAVETDWIGEVGDKFALYAGQEETFSVEVLSWTMDTSIITDYELKIEYAKY